MNVLLTDADVDGSPATTTCWTRSPPTWRRAGSPGGRRCPGGFAEGFDAPAIIRNSAGGYGYDITDVAAIRYRVDELEARRLIYVTDARQRRHFELAFEVADGRLPAGRRGGRTSVSGWCSAPAAPRSRPARAAPSPSTRCWTPPRSTPPPTSRWPRSSTPTCPTVCKKDYVFDAERMTQTTGDTGPYLQYAHSRCAGILREAAARTTSTGASPCWPSRLSSSWRCG